MKGLSFSEPMMKAWLAGNKTVTRRLLNPQPPDGYIVHQIDMETWGIFLESIEKNPVPVGFIKPRYLPGETVYIKEKWCICGGVDDCDELSVRYMDGQKRHGIPVDDSVYDHYAGQRNPYRWRSPMMMPAWASRSHAQIVSVIPERLQEINEIDAFLEGFRDQLRGETFWSVGAQFKEIWEIIHPGTWDQNPFVWRIELEKEKP